VRLLHLPGERIARPAHRRIRKLSKMERADPVSITVVELVAAVREAMPGAGLSIESLGRLRGLMRRFSTFAVAPRAVAPRRM
jgi:hypothetical protein